MEQFFYSDSILLQNPAIALRGPVSYKSFIIVVQTVNTHPSISVSLKKESTCKLCILAFGCTLQGGSRRTQTLRCEQNNLKEQNETGMQG